MKDSYYNCIHKTYIISTCCLHKSYLYTANYLLCKVYIGSAHDERYVFASFEDNDVLEIL